MILETLEATELFTLNNHYRQLSFVSLFGDYIVNGKIEGLYTIQRLIENGEFSDSDTIIHNTLIAFSQVDEPIRVVNVCQNLPDINNEFRPLLATAHISLNQDLDAQKVLKEYISQKTVLHTHDTWNLLQLVSLLNKAGEDSLAYFHDLLEQKSFNNPVERMVVEACCYSFLYSEDQTYGHKVLALISEIGPSFNHLTEEIQCSVCQSLNKIGEFKKSLELIEPLVDHTKGSYSHYLLIVVLYSLRKQHSRLLLMLKFWRENFYPLAEFYWYEINIRKQLNDHTEVIKLSQEYIQLFDKNPSILVMMISSFGPLDSSGEIISQILNEDLLEINFDWKYAFSIASTCIDKGFVELGLKLIYPLAKNNQDNFLIRQNYFALVTQTNHYREDKFKYNSVEEDTSVRISFNDQQRVIHINKDTLESIPWAKKLLGSSKGGFIEIDGSKIQVLDVLDKYSGLLAEIALDVEDDFKAKALNMKSVRWQHGDLESLRNEFIKEFGKMGEERKVRIELAFENYFNGKISFTELVQNIDAGKPFEIYDELTNNNSHGFLTAPVSSFKHDSLNDIEQYVIDITSLPVLMDLTDLLTKELESMNFVVSQYLVDHLRVRASEIENLEDDPKRMHVTMSGVNVIPYPDDFKESNLKRIRNWLDWINHYCKIEFVPEKLDIIPSPEEHNNVVSNWHFHYCLDTIFLSNTSNRALITDDLFYYVNFKSQVRPVSLEFFSKIHFQSKHDQVLLNLLGKNYLGITLNERVLIEAFEKSPILEASGNLFSRALINIPYSCESDEQVFENCIELVRQVYLSSFEPDHKKRIAQSIFIEGLKRFPKNRESMSLMLAVLRQRFHLMGTSILEAMEALSNAVEILNKLSDENNP